jgi:SAM-dependent methyltransferase
MGKKESPYFDISYDLFECRDCKCRFFDASQHEVNIDSIYQDYIPSTEFKQSLYWAFRKREILKSLGRSPTSILDVGCRTGDFLMHFSGDIRREGVELSALAAQIAIGRGIIVHAGNLEALEFDDTYDIVSAFAILEHLIEPEGFLRKLNTLVARNGVLMILTPSHQCLKTWLIDHCTRKRWHMYSPPEHLNFFSANYFDNYLKERGFELTSRSWTSGGVWNPFRRIPGVGFLFKTAMFLVDESPLRKIPIFDHMYSIYRKTK